MPRTIKRLSYVEAVRELDEATSHLERCRTELSRSQRNWEQALFNVLDALYRAHAGPPKVYTGKEPPE